MSADARAALEHLWHTAGGDPAALARVTLTGADPLLPTDFKIGGAASPDVTLEEIQDLLAESDSPFGRLRHVVPAGRLSETPPFWARPSVPLGTLEPAWPA